MVVFQHKFQMVEQVYLKKMYYYVIVLLCYYAVSSHSHSTCMGFISQLAYLFEKEKNIILIISLLCSLFSI